MAHQLCSDDPHPRGGEDGIQREEEDVRGAAARQRGGAALQLRADQVRHYLVTTLLLSNTRVQGGARVQGVAGRAGPGGLGHHRLLLPHHLPASHLQTVSGEEETENVD